MGSNPVNCSDRNNRARLRDELTWSISQRNFLLPWWVTLMTQWWAMMSSIYIRWKNKVTNSQKRHEEMIESISVVFDSSVFIPIGRMLVLDTKLTHFRSKKYFLKDQSNQAFHRGPATATYGWWLPILRDAGFERVTVCSMRTNFVPSLSFWLRLNFSILASEGQLDMKGKANIWPTNLMQPDVFFEIEILGCVADTG